MRRTVEALHGWLFPFVVIWGVIKLATLMSEFIHEHGQGASEREWKSEVKATNQQHQAVIEHLSKKRAEAKSSE